MADFFCTDCKTFVTEIHDRSSGDTICSECGLVLEAHFIDETSEWRVFQDSGDNMDPNRVGGSTNPLFRDIPLDTVIAGVKDEFSKANVSLGKKSNRLLSAFRSIASMVDRLSLVSTVEDRAKEIYKKLVDDDNKCCLRGRNSSAILAACVFMACQEENLPRTLKEICSVVSSEIKKKEIGRAKVYIMQHLKTVEEKDTNNKRIRATDYVRRFCSKLGTMDNHTIRAVFEAVQTSEEAIDIRRRPLSLAAAVIYIISQLMEEKKRPNLGDIVNATGVAEGTIKGVFKDLKPHIGEIVPRWFASGDELKNVCDFGL